MIVTADIETKGLDATKFLTGCIMKENGKKKHFYKKEEMWKYIIDLGRKELKRRKVLNIYCHNHEYDFYGYANLEDKNIEFVSFNPFIAFYRIDGKKAINFLDSMAIFRMSLAKLGEMIDLPKKELPKEFEEAQRVTKKRLIELKPYIERDVEIVMEGIKTIKDRLEMEGIKIRRMYTISQIAIAYLINELKKREENEGMFYDRKMGALIRPKNKSSIHFAYRGGRVEAFKTGVTKEVDYIDINNLYGYASTQIKFPELKSEQFIREPLEFTSQEELLNRIGISRVMIRNESNKLGLLPIRTETKSYYPKEKKYLVGTYTHDELKEAVKEGYKVIDIEWSILYKETENPFKEITTRLYELRNKEKNKFNKFFYKEMQNRSYGKLAQRKKSRSTIVDSVEKAEEYIEKNYEIIRGEGYKYFYRKENDDKDKNYYAPIIPTLINAWARVYMYRQLKKIPIKDLIYTDTDSCIMKKGHINKFGVSEKLGDFKVIEQGETIIVYGRKTYLIGDEVKVSGFRKSGVTVEDFEKGVIRSKKMKTLNTAKFLEEVGEFTEEERDLKWQMREHEESEKALGNTNVYIDADIRNINYFVEEIGKIVK